MDPLFTPDRLPLVNGVIPLASTGLWVQIYGPTPQAGLVTLVSGHRRYKRLVSHVRDQDRFISPDDFFLPAPVSRE